MATEQIEFSELPEHIRNYYNNDGSKIKLINRSDSIKSYLWMLSMPNGSMHVWDKPKDYRLRVIDSWQTRKH